MKSIKLEAIVSNAQNWIRLLIVLLVQMMLYGNLSAGGSFLKTYDFEGQTITRVNAVGKRIDNYLLALEGFDSNTGEFFSHLVPIDLQGNLQEGYSSAFIGEPNQLSSGQFVSNDVYELLTPVIEEFQPNDYRFRWIYANEDSLYTYDDCYLDLPDSVQCIVEFPSAIGKYIDHVFGSNHFLLTGRCIANNDHCSFVIEAPSNLLYVPPTARFTFIPDLIHISGITRLGSNYLIIGQDTNWSGKIKLTDINGNLLWQTTFTDGADASHFPSYTTPIMDYRWGNSNYTNGSRYISYQGQDLVLHIDKYENSNLTPLYSDQLDGFVNAIPLLFWNDTVTFCYLKDGVQIVRQIDTTGNTIWMRHLPGIGSFGKYTMFLHMNSDLNTSSIVVSGNKSDGVFLARLDAETGWIDRDESIQPQIQKFTVFPNPLQDGGSISIDQTSDGYVNISVYNLRGQRVNVLPKVYLDKGRHRLDFLPLDADSCPLPAGVYFIKLQTNSHIICKKILILGG